MITVARPPATRSAWTRRRRCTALALRQAIWRKPDPAWHVCGIPGVFYTGHGGDFTSAHLEQVAAELKIQLVFTTPGQPRGRGKIELLTPMPQVDRRSLVSAYELREARLLAA
jgi:transposase InsO family protein